jgi:hypothetical protein
MGIFVRRASPTKNYTSRRYGLRKSVLFETHCRSRSFRPYVIHPLAIKQSLSSFVTKLPHTIHMGIFVRRASPAKNYTSRRYLAGNGQATTHAPPRFLWKSQEHQHHTESLAGSGDTIRGTSFPETVDFSDRSLHDSLRTGTVARTVRSHFPEVKDFPVERAHPGGRLSRSARWAALCPG